MLSERNNLFVGFKPGLTLKLNKKIALQTSIGSFGYSNFESKFKNFKGGVIHLVLI